MDAALIVAGARLQMVSKLGIHHIVKVVAVVKYAVEGTSRFW